MKTMNDDISSAMLLLFTERLDVNGGQWKLNWQRDLLFPESSLHLSLGRGYTWGVG